MPLHDKEVHVLLVEDSPGDRRLICEMLGEATGARFCVTTVGRVSEGIERLSEGGIDVILLDLTLPDSQGMETFARVHARAPSVPVVVLTGLDDETLAVEAVRKGAQDYLVKGQVDGQLLARSIHYAIERRRVEGARERLLVSEREQRQVAERLAAENALLYADLQDHMDELTKSFCAWSTRGRAFPPSTCLTSLTPFLPPSLLARARVSACLSASELSKITAAGSG